MRIAYTSIDYLDHSIQFFDPDAVVSISSPRHPVDTIAGRRHFDLIMDDVEERRMRYPRHIDIEVFLEMLKSAQERLLIHCVAGLSRSPAFAITAAVAGGRSATAACNEVVSMVAHAQPNRLILQLADEVMGTDMLPAALDCFTYSRGRGRPDCERAGLCELFASDAVAAEQTHLEDAKEKAQ